MKKRQVIPVILTALLLTLQSNCSLSYAAPAPRPIDDATLDLIDPLDTLDEVDLQAMRDTIKMSRKNLARGTNAVNTLDYTVHDVYKPKGDVFVPGFMENMYVAANFGFEQILPQVDNGGKVAMMQLTGQIGTKLDVLNGIRLGLGGGWGYHFDEGTRILRGTAKFDWLHSLSNHFNGYFTDRTLELSTVLGFGGHYSFLRGNSGRKFAPELHAGLQFKIYTGPHGFINIEPYVGIGGPYMDRAYLKNWRGFDLFWGVTGAYEFTLTDHLTKAQRMRYLLHRLEKHPGEEYDKSDYWRKPWFFEASAGLAFSAADKLSFASTIGHTTTLSAGKWISPVMGFRFSAFTRIAQRDEMEVDEPWTFGPATLRHNTHYMGGRVEALLNPLGFFDSFGWDEQFGLFISAGGSLGTITKYQDTFNEKYRTGSEAYTFALHGYARITNDVQLFIEPRYEHNVYTEAKQFHAMNNMTVSMGLTMMMRSGKYRFRNEMDAIQEYTYKKELGFRIGMAAGAAMLSHRYKDYAGGAFEYNLQTWGDYIFNRLHGVRVNVDLMKTSHQEDWTGIVTRNLLFGSLDYQLNITNLCSGRLQDRKFNIEAYLGPAMMYCLSLDTEYGNPTDDKKYHFGVNGGFKLSFPLGKTGLSLYFNPQVYFINLGNDDDLLGANTIAVYKKNHLFQSINIGLQYKVGSLHRDREFLKNLHAKQDKSWKSRQIKAMAKYQEKYAKKIAKRHRK